MATYSRGLCALSAHACVRAHVIMARIIMAYLVTANKVAAYIVTAKYSYGLYTPCVRTRARTPSLDVVLFMWTGLLLLFARAVVLKDVLNILTIGLGFIMQATIMACILFE